MQDEITPHKAKYIAYLQTPEWQEKRQAALVRADHRCQLCSSRVRLHVHHRSYANLFREAPADLTVLCERCHRNHHGITDGGPVEKRRNGKPKLQAIKGSSLPVPCPFCGAPAGKSCRRPNGTPRSRIHQQRIKAAGQPRIKGSWQGSTIDFLATVPGASSRHVAERFKISQAQADGRLGHLSDLGRVVKLKGGWFAVGVEGGPVDTPLAPGWRLKGDVF